MSTDRDFRVEYSYKGQTFQRTITLAAGQYGTAAMREYNARVMIRQSTPFKNATEYNSFKIENVAEVLSCLSVDEHADHIHQAQKDPWPAPLRYGDVWCSGR